MGKVCLKSSIGSDAMLRIKELLEGQPPLESGQEPSVVPHVHFWVLRGEGEVATPSKVGRPGRKLPLKVRILSVDGNPKLTAQHLPLTVEVAEELLKDVEGVEPVMVHGHDIGKVGTRLTLEYSFVDFGAEITSVTPPVQDDTVAS